MMRITGGELRGRQFRTPEGGVRPTQDRVREAMFSSLGARVVDARVLDLYAGSGATGMEAWSRGAASVTWVEKQPKVYRTLRANVEGLCGAEAGRACQCADVMTFLRRYRGDPVDIVFADPPYDHADAAFDFKVFFQALTDQKVLEEDGILVFEQRASTATFEIPGWSLLKEKRYGETRLLIYKRKAATLSE